MKKKLLTALLLATLLFTLLMAGCSGDDKKSTDSNGSAEDVAPKTIVVGCIAGAGYPPLAFENEAGEADGVDVRVLKAIDEKLGDYEFEYIYQEMRATLAGLDSGTLNLGANMFEYNDERAEKYTYTDSGYMDFSTYIVVLEGTTGFNTLDDLQGKRVITYPSSNTAYILESYNEEHPDSPIEIVYSDSMDVQRQSLKSGDVDATLGTKFGVEMENAQFGSNQLLIEPTINESLAYFLFPKKNADPEFEKAFNTALDDLVADGTTAKIYDDLFAEWRAGLENQ
ncbi:MAG: transporter substrate-binding domain-containing protein [Clostridiales Family XIII bacterium]|nr:transporter substrate-binding domain-containing protein [Clostridiales Family XIII bacterium]